MNEVIALIKVSDLWIHGTTQIRIFIFLCSPDKPEPVRTAFAGRICQILIPASKAFQTAHSVMCLAIRFQMQNALPAILRSNPELAAGKGYHSSAEVKGNACFTCHSEHNGKDAKLIWFNAENFNHSLTGYTLSGAHAAKQCPDCHNSRYISDQKLKSKKNTYLGLMTSV
ncbi:MAG: hypothetical protein MZV63_01440 [Marinilabiliales bacterium]|nr:hypothetical protein [Marinilabiliales bacterium]